MIHFIHPWMLAGLAAVGLPVLVHFLTRPRPRVIRYPTMHLLMEAGSGRQALNRLRTWVILALRTLAIAALVLMFARPYWRAPGADAAPGEARRVVLLVDASMSMRAGQGGVPLFAKARAQAADLLRGLDEGSSAGVIFIGAKPRPVLPALSRNLATLHEGLSVAEATCEKGDPSAALALAERMLDGGGAVYVFSDFQRTDWAAVDFAGSGVGRTGHPSVAFYLRPVAERPVEHVGITALEKSPGEPVEGETVELTASVFNASSQKRTETVSLELEGVSQSATAEMQPYSTCDVHFAFSLPRAGVFPGEVRLRADDLADDNTRYFKVRVRRALRALVVSDADRDDHASGAFFVARALAPSHYVETGIVVTQRLSQDVDRNALETADVFFLVAPVRLGAETAAIISRRVSGGASLVCFLDGPTGPQLAATLAGASEGTLTPPFEMIRPVAASTDAGEAFGRVLTAHGPLRVFHSPDQGDLCTFRFARHYLTETESSRESEVLIAFGDGSAALALSPAGRGMVVFANFPIAPEASTFVESPLFPAMLHELLRALRRTGETGVDTPGTDWFVDVAASGDETSAWQMTSPEGKPVEATVVSRGRTVRLALAPVSQAGHYPVRAAGALTEVGVVNVDARETDTRAMNVADLARTRAEGGATVAVLSKEGDVLEAGRSSALWPHLAAFAAVMFALEMLLLAFWRRAPQRAAMRTFRGRAT